MKKTEENRYPNSATLFRFCKEALEIRYENNVKVIDQDVGAILGYDPADCSHWKKGKKNIRSLGTLRTIADHLKIDERLLIDIASGKVSLDEAVFEFKGYGAFSLRGRPLENLKKEYFKNPLHWQKGSDQLQLSFDDLFDVNRAALAMSVQKLLEMGQFTEAPIYIPEVYRLVPNLRLLCDDTLLLPMQITTEEGLTTVRYQQADMRPYVRFLLARELFKYLCRSANPIMAAFFESPEELLEIQANIFAGMLLVPAKMLKAEVETMQSSMDMVAQMADTFWVSKALMNQRLRDLLEHGL
jgi:hypothetical protein